MKREERLKAHIKNSGRTIKEFASDIDMPYTTLLSILKNLGGAGVDNVMRICAELGITVDSLDPSIDTADNPNPAESNLIKKYRTLDGHGKEAVDVILDLEHKRCITPVVDPTDDDDILLVCFIDQRVSAGNGTLLWDQYCDEKIAVPDTPTTRRADFALKVSGDSMEPEYNDGDIIFIEKTDAVDIGEIGIFIVGGEGYVKKLGRNRLISLNPKYEDIIIHEYDDIRCKGRVIGRM